MTDPSARDREVARDRTTARTIILGAVWDAFNMTFRTDRGVDVVTEIAHALAAARAEEREACAVECDKAADANSKRENNAQQVAYQMAGALADRIRFRGESDHA